LYAYVNDDVVRQVRSHLRFAAQRLDTGQWVMNLELADTAQREACGWFEIIETDPPSFDPLTQVSSSAIELVDGTPTRVWVVRPKTAEELAAQTAAANTQALSDVDVVLAKMGELKAFLTDPDVIAAEAQPNNTALTAAQQNRFNKAVARQLRRSANVDVRLFRYVFGQLHPELLDDISDT
jgi:hypothetical protein